LLLSLGVNVLTPLAVLVGVRQRWQGVMRLASVGVWTQFALLLLAFAILVFCFLTTSESESDVVFLTKL
jgi:cytochrome c-type biogenesis protein NrfE